MEKLAGIILAAGLSSRMGAFKPLLEIEGVSMVRRVVQLMRGTGADPVVVVTGHRRRELEERLQGTDVELIHNPNYASTQQLDSLRLALAPLEGQCDRLLISPADIPLVKPETVEALLRTPGEFVRPVCRGRGGHPVLVSAALIPALCSGALALLAVERPLYPILALLPYLIFWGGAALALARRRPLWTALPALLPFVPVLGLLLSPVLLDLSLVFPALGPVIRDRLARASFPFSRWRARACCAFVPMAEGRVCRRTSRRARLGFTGFFGGDSMATGGLKGSCRQCSNR